MTSFIQVLKSEYLKTKHTAAFWTTFGLASFFPVIGMIVFIVFVDKIAPTLGADHWVSQFNRGLAEQSGFFMPMLVVLATSMLVQLEVKNNAWKQVFATPATPTQIFFAKFLVIQIMIALYFVIFILMTLITGILLGLINSKYHFLNTFPDFKTILYHSGRYIFYLLPISALQYWLSLRFKNFIASFGVGMVLIISGIIAFGSGWEHIYCYPYVQALLSSMHTVRLKMDPDFAMKTFGWTIGYIVLFLGLGYLDFLKRKER